MSGCATATRAALWAFQKLDTLRTALIHRTGRFTRPQGILTLALNANPRVRQTLLILHQALQAMRPAA